MTIFSRTTFLASLLAACLLAACSPKYNWRDYRGNEAPFAAMFPDKPATYTRAVDLNGMKVNMTMTAAEIDGVMFAIGTGEAPDVVQAQAALGLMKMALINNIGATVTKEGDAKQGNGIEVEATGIRNGTPMRMVAHFEARGTRFYQVIVVGKQQAIAPEQVDMFMSSFKPN